MQAHPRLVQVTTRAEEIDTAGDAYVGIRRILVDRSESLGPLVLALPALAALRDAYASAWIALLVRPSTAALASLVPVVDQVLEMPAEPGRLAALIRAFRADLLIAMSPGGRVPLAAAAARVPHRAGFARRVYSPLFERRVDVTSRGRERHEVEHALALAHRVGARAGPARFPIAFPAAAGESAGEWLEAHHVARPFAVLRIEGFGGCPSWPAGHFVRLATLLEAEGCRVVFSVGPGDEATSRALDAAELAVRRMPRFTGDLTTLPALLRLAPLVVGNSTGTVHLAAALGTPTLMLHGPWRICAAERWGPYAANGWSLVAESTEARQWSARDRARHGTELLSTMSPALVLSAALALLDGREPSL